MGKNNRARRAAKQRKRKTYAGHAQQRPGNWTADGNGVGSVFGMAAPPPDEQIERTLGSAAYEASGGDPILGDRYLVLLGHLDELYQPQVDRGVRSLLERLVRGAWEGGWQPADLAELARRRIEAAAEPLLLEAIASEHRRYTDPTLDPRWREQLADLGLRDRRPGELHLTDWAQRRRLGRADALRVAVAVAAFLLTLPVLPTLLPLPGTASSQPVAARRSGGNEKVLGRIRALLAKAEATEFSDEAEALSEKAQELMAKFSLDRALVDAGADARGSADGPTARRIWVEPPYVSAKTNLVHAVASANRCRTITYDSLGFITVVGDELDLQLTELLATSLLLQANRAVLAAGPQTGRYGQSQTRSYRQSFLVAYGIRIGERLRTASQTTHAAVAEADAGRLLPVLARREEQVDALFATLFPDTVLRQTKVSNGAGWAAGRTAADLATLDAHKAVGSQ